jgi:hypothetical protein
MVGALIFSASNYTPFMVALGLAMTRVMKYPYDLMFGMKMNVGVVMIFHDAGHNGIKNRKLKTQADIVTLLHSSSSDLHLTICLSHQRFNAADRWRIDVANLL